jgi:hypothetical protein
MNVTWRHGALLSFPESDPVCGPGSYNLSTLVLALGAATQGTLVTLEVVLFSADAISFPVFVYQLPYLGSFLATLSVDAAPAYITIPVPAATLTVDTVQVCIVAFFPHVV